MGQDTRAASRSAFASSSASAAAARDGATSMLPDNLLASILALTGAEQGPTLTLVCTRWHRLFWAHCSPRCQLALRVPLAANKQGPCLYDFDVAAAEKLLASQHSLVARLAPRLAAFSLTGGHAVQHAAHRCGAWGVPQLLRLLPTELASLQLDYCSPRVAAQCKRLTGLTRLHIHDSLSAASTSALLSRLPRLRCLRLTMANWTADVAAGLAQQTELTQLRLRLFGGFIPLLSPANYACLASLGHLTLWCYEMPAATLGMLGHFSGLTSLELSDNPFDLDGVLAGLPAMPRLRSLALHPRVSSGGRTALPTVRRQLAKFPALTAFEYRNTWRPNPSGIQVGSALLAIYKFSLSEAAEGAAGAACSGAQGKKGKPPSMPSMALELQVSGLLSLQSLLEAVVPPGMRLRALKLLGSCLPEEAVLGCAALGQLAALDLEGCQASPVTCAVLRSAMGGAPPSLPSSAARLAPIEGWRPAGAPAPAAC